MNKYYFTPQQNPYRCHYCGKRRYGRPCTKGCEK